MVFVSRQGELGMLLDQISFVTGNRIEWVASHWSRLYLMPMLCNIEIDLQH